MKLKTILGVLTAFCLIALMSVAAHAATMFNMGTPTIGTYVVVPVYFTSTEYTAFSGYDIDITYDASKYTYVRVSNQLKDEWDEALGSITTDTTQLSNGNVGYVYNTGGPSAYTENGTRLLFNVYFTATSSVTADDVLADIGIRPRQFSYDDENGANHIMPTDNQFTYITYTVPATATWDGYIEELYIKDENGVEYSLASIVDNGDDTYDVVVMMDTSSGNKVITDLTLCADTASTEGGEVDTTGVVLYEFPDVVIENLTKLS